ncbi:Uncharacterised protein [Mycobacteroides abscessus subsp. abscessus]|nr:Uncharacterised protein [Mycobacteroides abscessus subsp. abscessus]
MTSTMILLPKTKVGNSMVVMLGIVRPLNLMKKTSIRMFVSHLMEFIWILRSMSMVS